ncbi:MAG: SDR family oxidoreductase [Chitinophagaceae bacterium]|nr:SDR family oxidoreductase [Chitinophagaceae bacterium]MCA6511677.1 SDR family oxidoreductase [Chitinophagaceae bacterium]
MSKEQYILVTGASSGIGAFISKSLSNSRKVILHGRNIEKINQVIAECNNPSQQLAFVADLEEYENLETLLGKFILDRNIEISGFVHCAGFMNMLPAKMTNAVSIKKIFSTNLFSASIIVKVLLQRKVNAGALKNVVFISSNISNFGAKAFSLYSASKAGIDGLMRSLAVELAPSVRVNSVLPGAIHTPMTDVIFRDEEKAKSILSTYPLGEGFPEDISNMVEFLLSDKSKWITGQQFTVDGGRTIDISG